MNRLPYSDIFVDLLSLIHSALGYCHKTHSAGKQLLESDEYLAKLFQPIEKEFRVSGLNKHLTIGLNNTIQMRQHIFPRLSKLVIFNYLQAQTAKAQSNYQAEILPSPLQILYQALTVPEEPQTAAYSFVLCRSMLFYFLKIHPQHVDLDPEESYLKTFKENDILKSISSFKSHINQQARWPDPRMSHESFNAKIHYLNGHLLSIKGIAYLWFNNSKQLQGFCEIRKGNNLGYFQQLYSNAFETENKFSFRLSNRYVDLPDASEIINWIFGLPLPIRGADILFHGGLKKSANSGLVISLHGLPGVGKTSAALSLAAVLSPFKTKCIYISLEEEPDDLRTRLFTLIPEHLRWLSIFENNNNNSKRGNDGKFNWFTTFKLKDKVTVDELTEILKILHDDLERTSEKKSNTTNHFRIPTVCPLLIVIDNVNELFSEKHADEQYNNVQEFIEQCRAMGALVVLISADNVPAQFKLNYLVDVVMHLRQDSLSSRIDKPVRILELIKTRHQISRQGSHVYHLSNSKGFRISPQVPSQIDKREKIKIELPSTTEFTHCLDIIGSGKAVKISPFLPIAQNSQILIHGHGSSGKAGFGMKILLMPDIKAGLSENISHVLSQKESSKISHRGKIPLAISHKKVLIISFLYPEDYYVVLHSRLKAQFKDTFSNFVDYNNKIVVKAFYPGYLTPEDFVNRIVRILEEARLEGAPFTGILLDGLHNIFLQFKGLQEHHMVWPLLYSILSRYNLSVVSTFTNFSLDERLKKPKDGGNRLKYERPDDLMLLQQGQKPFLHGLVKAADYYFFLEEILNNEEEFNREYWISVKSSIRTVPPTNGLKWDREKLIVLEHIDGKEMYT